MTLHSTIDPKPRAASHKPEHGAQESILVLSLAGEHFGLDVTSVHEILDPLPVTRVPDAPAFAPGLVNVRGTIVPMLDLYERLGMSAPDQGGEARIVVLEVEIDGQGQRLAFCADAVDAVIEIDPSGLSKVPELGARWPERYVRGAIRIGERLVVVLDREALFQPDSDPSDPVAGDRT
jgi:purine-binding chemotaxis protein CheW